jgi:hypothetical protein
MMGWDYVSKLQPPTGLLFIPWVIREHGEPWWWCPLGITPDSLTIPLWQSYQRRHLGQVEGMDEGVRILRISIWNSLRDILHAVKSYMGPPTLLLIRRKVCCGFVSPLKPIASAGFELATLESTGKHTNHYTTEAPDQPDTLPRPSWKQKVHFRVHNSTPTDPIIPQLHPVSTLQPYSPKIHLILYFHLHVGLPSGHFPSGFPTRPA